MEHTFIVDINSGLGSIFFKLNKQDIEGLKEVCITSGGQVMHSFLGDFLRYYWKKNPNECVAEYEYTDNYTTGETRETGVWKCKLPYTFIDYCVFQSKIQLRITTTSSVYVELYPTYDNEVNKDINIWHWVTFNFPLSSGKLFIPDNVGLVWLNIGDSTLKKQQILKIHTSEQWSYHLNNGHLLDKTDPYLLSDSDHKYECDDGYHVYISAPHNDMVLDKNNISIYL